MLNQVWTFTQEFKLAHEIALALITSGAVGNEDVPVLSFDLAEKFLAEASRRGYLSRADVKNPEPAKE